MTRPSTAAVATLGIDIGKNVGSTAAVSPSFYDFKSLSAVRFRPCRRSTATMVLRANALNRCRDNRCAGGSWSRSTWQSPRPDHRKHSDLSIIMQPTRTARRL
jgi:hypothetical protein